jgi:uncharacterized protein
MTDRCCGPSLKHLRSGKADPDTVIEKRVQESLNRVYYSAGLEHPSDYWKDTRRMMDEKHVAKVARELGLKAHQVKGVASLLDEGATIPFIARYRKEATGSLDEVAVAGIRDRLEALRELDKRRESILKTLEETGKLTDELRQKVLAAETLAILEDIYLPYRPKRRTRATIAREKGLEPLAGRIFTQEVFSVTDEAQLYVNEEKGVASAEEALEGARDIIAEWVNEDEMARAKMRTLYASKGMLRSKVAAGKEEEAEKFRDYFDWSQPAVKAPSHRVLALLRGESEGMLVLHLLPPEEDALAILERLFMKGDNEATQQVKAAIRDSYKRLLSPSMETETQVETKKRADGEAIRVFHENLRQLLLAPPLGQKRVMAIDPGFRTGCKVVCLDGQGKLLHAEAIYPHTTSAEGAQAAGDRVRELCRQFGVEAIAIGRHSGKGDRGLCQGALPAGRCPGGHGE